MQLTRLIALCAVLCLPGAALAGGLKDRAGQNQFSLTPLYTLNARNVQAPTVTLRHDEFRNVRMEEARDFDGYTQSAELLVPFGAQQRWEVRLELPFNTRGEARTVAGNRAIDIDGRGGIFDFTTLAVQRELITTADSPLNASVYVGFGHRLKPLETDIKDKYNHRGRVARFGFNLDNARADRDLRLQGTLDYRYYFDTDDLNPSNDGETFSILNLSGAMVYNAAGWVKPAFELLYSTDFNQRTIVQAVPEVIVPLNDWLEIKGGCAFGHSDGEGSTSTATLRTTFSF